jgi:hypothetical protein
MARYFYLTFFLLVLIFLGCDKAEYQADSIASFVSDFEASYQQLDTGRNMAMLKRVSTGQSDSLQYYDDRIANLLDDQSSYDRVVAYRKIVRDDVLKRKLEIIYHLLLRNRIDGQPAIRNLIDSLNINIDRFSRTSVSDIVNSPGSYFLCDFSIKNMSRADKKLLNEIGDGLRRLVRLRNLAAKQLGYNSYYSINELVEYGGAIKSDMILDQLEEKSDSLYRSIFNISDDSSANNIESLCDLLNQQSDIEKEYGYYFDFDGRDRRRILVNTFKYVGFDINKLPIYFIEPDSTIISDSAYCFPINCPNDIRVVTNSPGNIRSFYSLYHAVVTAIYASHLDQSSYLFWINQTSLRSEVIRSFFDNLISTAKWREENLNLPRDFAFRYTHDAYKFKILDTRIRLLVARFEKQLYLKDAWQVKDVFGELFDRMLHYSLIDSIVWWSIVGEYVNHPFYARRKLVADLAAAQMWDAMTADGTDIESAQFYYPLIDGCFAPGQRYDWHDMLLQTTGYELDAGYYLRRSDSTAVSGD